MDLSAHVVADIPIDELLKLNASLSLRLVVKFKSALAHSIIHIKATEFDNPL